MVKTLSMIAIFVISGGIMAAEIEKTYQKSCSICHVPGVANAPKTGDKEAWAQRLSKGMDVLVASVINGKGAMPPKGMCYSCSEDDYEALINHMVAQ